MLPRLGNSTPPADVSGLLNLDLADTLLKAKPAASEGGLPLLGGGLPLVGGSGEDPLSSLNLDGLLEMVDIAGKSGKENKAKAIQAKGLINQFKLQTAGKPSDVPLDISALPVGVDLMKVLADLSDTAKVGAPVQVNFKIDQPKAASNHTATSLIWPKGAKDFPVDQGGAWKGEESTS